MSTTASYEFGWPNVTELGTFQADFAQSVMSEVPRKGKNGDYIAKEWSVVVQSAKISIPVKLTGVSAKNYDRMRLLTLMGLKNLTVTRGMAAVGQPASFAPYIISGVA